MNGRTRTAIVTGASRGIGAAIARRLAADGFRTIVNFNSNLREAEALVAGIAAAGGAGKAVRAEVSDAAAMRALFDEAEAAFDRVDVLVNNAGLSRPALLRDANDGDYQRLMAVNLTGAFNGMREAAGRLPDGGRIINISTSIIGHYQPTHGVYVAAKAGVEAMTRTLAKELGARGITVNAVAPGPVATEMFLTGRSEDVIARMTADIPLGRLGRPEDIAGAVAFLAGPDGSYVNGQVIKVNGGRN